MFSEQPAILDPAYCERYLAQVSLGMRGGSFYVHLEGLGRGLKVGQGHTLVHRARHRARKAPVALYS